MADITVEDLLDELVTIGDVSIGMANGRIIATFTPRKANISPITEFGDTLSQALAAVYGELIARLIRKEVTR